MERSPDDLLVDRSLDDEPLDENPALPDGFHDDPIMDIHYAMKRREQLDTQLNHLADEEIQKRGFSIHEILHPRIIRWLNKIAEKVGDKLIDEENSKK